MAVATADNPVTATIGPGAVHLSFERAGKDQNTGTNERRMATATSDAPKGQPCEVRLFFVDTLL